MQPRGRGRLIPPSGAPAASRRRRPCSVVQASIWEQNASLTDDQQAAVDMVAAICGQRPLPSKVRCGGRAGPRPGSCLGGRLCLMAGR